MAVDQRGIGSVRGNGGPTIQKSITAVYDRLPPGERRLADIVLSRLNHLASYSATELAEASGVSKATAARFFRRVGYGSFDEARRQARAEAHLASPLYALAGVNPNEPFADALSRHVAADLRNLSETFQAVDVAALAETVALLAAAPRVRVVGMRNGRFIAAHAAYLLAQVRPEVAALPEAAMALAEDLVSLGGGDVLLVLDFRRRSAWLPCLIAAARHADVRLVFVAGAGMPALARAGDVVLQCRTDGASIFDSYVAAVSLVNYLCTATAKSLGASSRQRLASIETLHQALGDIET